MNARLHSGFLSVALAALLTVVGAATAATPPASGQAGASPASRVASCNWDRPGHDPYMGDVVSAVDRYADIPAPVRERLKERMAARQYDDIAEISRDRIEGRSSYGPAITDMHFGTGRICSTVTRTGWHDDTRERGLVYCEGQQCIIVPTVCRNVSRVTRQDVGPALAEGPMPFDAPGAGEQPAAAVAPADPGLSGMVPDAPLAFEAPQAGQDRGYVGGFSGFGGGFSGGGPFVLSSTAGAAQPASGNASTVLPGAPITVVGLQSIAGAVPEPSTWGLMLLGGALLAATQRRRDGRLSPSATA